jgi:hypothetical protein
MSAKFQDQHNSQHMPLAKIVFSLKCPFIIKVKELGARHLGNVTRRRVDLLINIIRIIDAKCKLNEALTMFLIAF